MPKVSVVIPVYNAESFLRETLESVKNQTFVDFECVIVDDGSTDDSVNIISEYADNDSRFKYTSTNNSGCANIPRRIAISNSIGEFIFNLDADDLLEQNCIKRMVERQTETQADIVLLTVIGCIKGLKGELWRLPLSAFDTDQILRGVEACKLTIGRWQISCNGMFAKKELFEGVPKGNLFISDEIVSRHLLFKSNKVAFANTNYYYRNNETSITRAMTPKVFERLLTDEELDDFISDKFKMYDDVGKDIRNARFFNMIHMYNDFIKYKGRFSKLEKDTILYNFKKTYHSQNRKLLKEELPIQFQILFLCSFRLFEFFSPIYVNYKVKMGKIYIYK